MADGVDIRDRDIGRPSVPWQEIARSKEFRRLESLRRRAMLVTLGIFLAVFGTFLVMSGYARPFMHKSVDGVNVSRPEMVWRGVPIHSFVARIRDQNDVDISQ